MSKKNTTSFLETLVSWGSLIALFITPLIYFSSRFGGAVTSKQFFFIGSINLLIIAWVWLLVTDSRYRFSPKNWYVLLPGTALFLSAGVSTFFGADVAMSLFSSVARGIGFIFIVHAYIFSLILASVGRVQGYDFFKKVIKVIFYSGILVALSTFFTSEAFDIGSVWLNDTAGGGTLGNSSLAGTFLVFGLFAGIASWFISEKRTSKIVAAIGTLIILLSPIFFNIKGFFVTQTAWAELVHNPLIVMGQARAAAIAVVIGLVVSVLMYGYFGFKKAWAKFASLTAVIAIVISLVMVFIGFVTPGSSLNSVFIERVGQNRLIFWNEAAQGIKERPMIGWGLENYRMVHNKYLDPVLLGKDYGYEVWTDKPHNIFVEVLVHQGIIGLIAYIAVLGSLVGYTIVSANRGIIDKKVAAVVIGMVVAYVVQNQFVFDSITSTVIFWTLIGTFTGMVLFKVEYRANKPAYPGTIHYVVGVVISILAFIAWIMFAIIPSQKMIEAKKVFDAKIVTRVTKYEQLFSGFGVRYLMTDLGVVSYGLAETFSNERQLITAEPKHTEIALKEIEFYQKVVDDHPFYTQHDYRVRLAQAMFNEIELSMRGSYTEAEVDQMVNRIEEVIRLSPTNPLGYLVYGRILVFADRIDDARSMMKKGITLNPKIKEAHDLLNSFESFYGTAAQKREALENAKKNIPGYEYTSR